MMFIGRFMKIDDLFQTLKWGHKGIQTQHGYLILLAIFPPYGRKISLIYLRYVWLCSPCGLWLLFPFLNLYAVGRTPWTGDQPVARSLPTHRTTQTQNKYPQISTPQVGFEPKIPVLERPKTVHALDRASTVIGHLDV
jgi:hypothetical protein